MKTRLTVTVDRAHPGTRLACLFMALAALIRLGYYLSPGAAEAALWLHLLLPVLAALCFLSGMALGGRYVRSGCLAAVALGVVFFILKAQTFAPVHKTLCTILYLAVLVLFWGTLLGWLPTKKLLYPLFGLPFLYHLLVEDTRLYFFADPPVPVFHWLPEVSVLCIMAGLFCLTFGLETRKR